VATFDTLGSTFNTLLAVYVNDLVTNLTPIASNDDIDPANGVLQSRVVFNAAGLTMYHIAIDGFNGETGNSMLNWKLTAGAPSPLVASLTQGYVHGPITRVDQPALAYRSLAAGELQLIIKGKPPQLYRIEVSEDLKQWRPLVTTVANGDGLGYFTDKSTHSMGRTAVNEPICGPGRLVGVARSPRAMRFYRAVASTSSPNSNLVSRQVGFDVGRPTGSPR